MNMTLVIRPCVLVSVAKSVLHIKKTEDKECNEPQYSVKLSISDILTDARNSTRKFVCISKEFPVHKFSFLLTFS